MCAAIGSVVSLKVTFVAGYACWGTVNDKVGFIHISEWSWKHPIPESDSPVVGAQLQARVLHIVDGSRKANLPADATFGVTLQCRRLRRIGPPSVSRAEPVARSLCLFHRGYFSWSDLRSFPWTLRQP